MKRKVYDRFIEFDNFVVTKKSDENIEYAIQYPEYQSEIIDIKKGYNSQGFGGYILRNREKLWRREILRAVTGDTTIEINDERVTDFAKYNEAIKDKPVTVFRGFNNDIKNRYCESPDLTIKGIVGTGIDEELAFFPEDIDSIFQRSDDLTEEYLIGFNGGQFGE